VADHTDEGAWAIVFLFPILVLGALVRGGSAGLRNLKDRCHRFESGDWEGLLDDHHEAGELLAERFEEGEHGAAQLAMSPPMRRHRRTGSAAVFGLDGRVSLAVRLGLWSRVDRLP
jgi:hypothetical protein